MASQHPYEALVLTNPDSLKDFATFKHTGIQIITKVATMTIIAVA